MPTTFLHSVFLASASRRLRANFAAQHEPHDCPHSRNWWRRLRRNSRAVLLEGSRYCLEYCLLNTLRETVDRQRSSATRIPPRHRVPLGLLMLSRQQVTVEQLRIALDTQRTAGHGRIGEWLQGLGFVGEEAVTAALARQWSCPILRSTLPPLGPNRLPEIPLTLLQSYAMIPVDFVEARATLHIAFAEGIDYGVLHAMERMLDCHTEPCMATPSQVRNRLQLLFQRRRDRDTVFERVDGSPDAARIIHSYCVRVSPAEVRLSSMGGDLWVRLLREDGDPFDLMITATRCAEVLMPSTTTVAPKVLRAAADGNCGR
jgi:hypothetical protein